MYPQQQTDSHRLQSFTNVSSVTNNRGQVQVRDFAKPGPHQLSTQYKDYELAIQERSPHLQNHKFERIGPMTQTHKNTGNAPRQILSQFKQITVQSQANQALVQKKQSLQFNQIDSQTNGFNNLRQRSINQRPLVNFLNANISQQSQQARVFDNHSNNVSLRTSLDGQNQEFESRNDLQRRYRTNSIGPQVPNQGNVSPSFLEVPRNISIKQNMRQTAPHDFNGRHYRNNSTGFTQSPIANRPNQRENRNHLRKQDGTLTMRRTFGSIQDKVNTIYADKTFQNMQRGQTTPTRRLDYSQLQTVDVRRGNTPIVQKTLMMNKKIAIKHQSQVPSIAILPQTLQTQSHLKNSRKLDSINISGSALKQQILQETTGTTYLPANVNPVSGFDDTETRQFYIPSGQEQESIFQRHSEMEQKLLKKSNIGNLDSYKTKSVFVKMKNQPFDNNDPVKFVSKPQIKLLYGDVPFTAFSNGSGNTQNTVPIHNLIAQSSTTVYQPPILDRVDQKSNENREQELTIPDPVPTQHVNAQTSDFIEHPSTPQIGPLLDDLDLHEQSRILAEIAQVSDFREIQQEMQISLKSSSSRGRVNASASLMVNSYDDNGGSIAAGSHTLQDLIIKGRNEVRAASTIANARNQKLLVTHRAGGGGGPFSRMTKFQRLDSIKTPVSRRFNRSSIGSSKETDHQSANFRSIGNENENDSVREERRMTASSRQQHQKFQSLEIRATQVIPGKMYRLPPVLEESRTKRQLGCEMGTSTTPLPYDEELDGERPVRYAYKEGHFIPGQDYAGTKNFSKADPSEITKQSVVLKQMQPKMFKFNKQQRRSPRISSEFKKGQIAENSQDAFKLAAVRQSCDTYNAGTPRETQNSQQLMQTLIASANFNIQDMMMMNSDSQKLVNLHIQTAPMQQQVNPQMIRSYEVDQSCGTDENWAQSHVHEPSTEFNYQEETNYHSVVSRDEPVKVIQSSHRPQSHLSSEPDNMYYHDSMVSFECRPNIQANYNFMDPSPDQGVIDEVTDDQRTSERVTPSSPPKTRQSKRTGSKLSSIHRAKPTRINLSKNQQRATSQGQDRDLVRRVNPMTKGPIQTVIRNGQAVLVQKGGGAKSPTGLRSSKNSLVMPQSQGEPFKMNLGEISKRQNYNEQNIQLPIADHNLRKSLARDSISTVNNMIERTMRSSFADQKNSVTVSNNQATRENQTMKIQSPGKVSVIQTTKNSKDSSRMPSPRLKSRLGLKSPADRNQYQGTGSIPPRVQTREQNENLQIQAVNKVVMKRQKTKTRGKQKSPIHVQIFNVSGVSGYNSPTGVSSKEKLSTTQNNQLPAIVSDYSVGTMIKKMDMAQSPLQTAEKTAQESKERLQTKYMNPAQGMTLRKRFESPGMTIQAIQKIQITEEESEDEFGKTLRMNQVLQKDRQSEAPPVVLNFKQAVLDHTNEQDMKSESATMYSPITSPTKTIMAEESKMKLAHLANQGSQVDYFPMEKTPNSLELDKSATQILKIETVVNQAPAVSSRPAAIQTNMKLLSINKDIESHL